MSPSWGGCHQSVTLRQGDNTAGSSDTVIHSNWHLPEWELGPQLIDICCKTIANWPSKSDLFSCNAHIEPFIKCYRGPGYFTLVSLSYSGVSLLSNSGYLKTMSKMLSLRHNLRCLQKCDLLCDIFRLLTLQSQGSRRPFWVVSILAHLLCTGNFIFRGRRHLET